MFSIVVNCSDFDLDYLENCLKSLLLQTYENFEIITILNIEENLKKNCKKIINKFKKEKKIKFFFTKKKLKINESFQYGLELSSREWILYCCADDCLLQKSLEILNKLIKKKNTKLICWALAGNTYHHEKKILKFDPNIDKKYINFYTIKTIKVLEKIFEDMLIIKQKRIIPFIPRAVFNKSIVNSKFFFGKSDPMSYSGIYNLFHVDSYLYLDLNLTIIGESNNSLSALHHRQKLFEHKSRNTTYSKNIDVNNYFSKKIFSYLKDFNFSSFNRLSHMDYLCFCLKNFTSNKKYLFLNSFNKWKKKNHSNFILSIFEELCERKYLNFFLHYFQLIKSLYKINNSFNFIKYFFQTIKIFIKFKINSIYNKITFPINFKRNHRYFDNMFLVIKFYSTFSFKKKKIILIDRGDYFA